MVIPHLVTDSVFLCVLSIQSNKGKKKTVVFLIHSHAHKQMRPAFLSFVPHTSSSEQCQWHDTYRFHWLAGAWALLSRSLSVLQLSDSARCDEEGSVDTQQRACLLPRKKTHTPSRGETGLLNYICLQLRMCCGCNVTQTNNGSDNIRQKNGVGDDVLVTCISCNSVKNEAIYKDNRFVLFEKRIIWKTWPAGVRCRDKLDQCLLILFHYNPDYLKMLIYRSLKTDLFGSECELCMLIWYSLKWKSEGWCQQAKINVLGFPPNAC